MQNKGNEDTLKTQSPMLTQYSLFTERFLRYCCFSLPMLCVSERLDMLLLLATASCQIVSFVCLCPLHKSQLRYSHRYFADLF